MFNLNRQTLELDIRHGDRWRGAPMAKVPTDAGQCATWARAYMANYRGRVACERTHLAACDAANLETFGMAPDETLGFARLFLAMEGVQ